MTGQESLAPGQLVEIPSQQHAHVWVRDGAPSLTVITNAADDFSADWPAENGPLIIFDAGFDVTITAIET